MKVAVGRKVWVLTDRIGDPDNGGKQFDKSWAALRQVMAIEGDMIHLSYGQVVSPQGCYARKWQCQRANGIPVPRGTRVAA